MNYTRETEQAKYSRLYEGPLDFRMGALRRDQSVANLSSLGYRGSFLDVGCGRGDMLEAAAGLGFAPIRGVDCVPALCDGGLIMHGEAHDLPISDDVFDVVTMNDVIEHLVPGDDEAACRELARVAVRCVILTASNLPSVADDGTNLHINIRPYSEWNRFFVEWFAPHRVSWISENVNSVSESWRVDLDPVV